MVSHGRARLRAADTPRRLRRYRDQLILAFCVLGLLSAWLVYGLSGAGNPSPPGIGEPPGSLLSATVEDPPASPGTISAEYLGQEPALAAIDPADNPAEPLAAGGARAAGGTPAAGGAPAVGAAPAVQPASSFPAASAPQRITYPAAGMDVVVHPLEPDSSEAQTQSIVPPETMDGYWLTPFGTPGAGSANTTYIIGHSWLDRDAPFNHLSSAATAGDEFTVVTAAGKMTYRVESVTTYTKATLKDSPIWTVVPNRLVLISCYTEDPWGRNVTVVASPVPGS